MACSGFLSIRVFAVVFQIVVLFAILKFFNGKFYVKIIKITKMFVLYFDF